MKGFVALALLSVLLIVHVGCGSNAQEKLADENSEQATLQFDASQSDSAAIALAEKVALAAGGSEQLAGVQQLSFQFKIKADSGVVSAWRHDWDRSGQRYRLSGALTSGEQVLVFLNLDTQDGQAFINGNPAPEDELQALLAMAYSRFTSDTYWLLFPFKLKDAGARLEYHGVKQIEATTFEVLHLSFIDDVGLTPENEFEIFIDPATHEIRRWEYFENPEAEPRIAWWDNWQSFGRLKFATQRRLAESDRVIFFEEIVASPQVEDAIFTAPSLTQAGMK